MGMLFCFVLTGCATDGVETVTEADSTEPPAVTATEPATEIAKAAPAEPEDKPPSPPPDLMGKQRAEIIEILGRPAFSRRDRPALLLRYRQHLPNAQHYSFGKKGTLRDKARSQ